MTRAAGPSGRLHAWSWMFLAAGTLKELALAVLAPLAFVVVKRDDDVIPLAIAAGVAVLAGLWGWLRARSMRYEVLADEIVIQEGVFTRESRKVPFSRVQSVSERRGLFHRLVDATELVLESGSGGKPEAVMRVLYVHEAAWLAEQLRLHRAALQAAPAGDASAPAGAGRDEAPGREAGVLLKLPTTELLKLGVISNRGFLVAAMIAGAVSQNTNLLKLLPGTDRLALTVEAGLREAVAAGTLQLGLWLLGMLLVAVVVVRLLSLVYWVGTQHGFTLTRDGDRLRVRRGLFTRVDVSGRVAAVQRLTLERSLMHRLFNRCTLRVDLPVSQIAVPGSAPRLDHLAPIATPAQARALIDECLPGLDLEALDWQPLHRSAAWRRAQGTLLRLLPPLSVAVGLAFVLPALPADAGRVSLAVAAALVGAGLWHAWRWAATAGFAVGAGVVVWRSGVFTRTWVMLPENQAQAVVLRRSPRDRRRGTARLCVDGQALTVTRALDIPWLAEADAAGLRARLWHAAGPPRTA